jgi:MEDS: MEthanogen/methylotroph, DcmR Sensory domain
MGLGASTVRVVATPPPTSCRLVTRSKEGLPEVVAFVVAGLEAGQQVFAMGGPAHLKDIACSLGGSGLKPESLLRAGRLIFLTAPDCISTLLRSENPFGRGPLQRNTSLVRWVSDWSWACSNGFELRTVLGYQRRIHEFVRSLTALSMCTVDSEKLERSSLLAMMADHRRASKAAAQTAGARSPRLAPFS